MRRATRSTKTPVTRRRLTGSSAVALLVLTTIACVPRPLPVMTTFDASALASVQMVATTETALSSTGVLTPTQALAIRQRLRPVIECGERSTTALIVWQPGQAIPPDLLALSAAMGALLQDVVAMLPDDSPAKLSLLSVIATAQAAWADIVRMIVGGQA